MNLNIRLCGIILSFAASLSVTAAIPDGYYDSLEGLSKAQLKDAAKKRVRSHKAVSYNSGTWEAFEKTDVKIVNGREAWWDMYSDNVVYVSEGHPGLNIEHSVANSWWGGSNNDAYKDLFHLNPSNSEANGWKSNYPLGVVVEVKVTNKGVRYDNGVTKVGKPASGTSGGASLVYEPADCYKGDFARAFFYMFTVYDDISWMTSSSDRNYMFDGSAWPSLRPWAYELLLEWARLDPVDDKEINRNEAIYAIQGNRNPYIDIPELAEYVWGSKTSEPFHLGAVADPAVAMPQFEGYPESCKWWEPFTLRISCTEGEIEYAFGNDAFSAYSAAGIEVPQAEYAGQQLKVRARTRLGAGEEARYSSVATLLLTAVDPTLPEPEEGTWTRIQSGDELSENDIYALVETTGDYVMSYNVSSSKSASMLEPTASTAGYSDASKSVITELPGEAARLKFHASGSNYNIEVADENSAFLGWLCSTSAKNLYLSPEINTGCSASVRLDGTAAVITFSGAVTLQYNVQAPRFTTYTSDQGDIALYRFVKSDDPGLTGVQHYDSAPVVYVSGRDIIAPEGAEAYNAGGMRVPLTSLTSGLYIVRTGTKAVKVIVR